MKLLGKVAKGRAHGLIGLLRGWGGRVVPSHVHCYRTAKRCLRGKTGLEIGGPSQVFDQSGPFPIYALAHRIDNCNFSGHTIWEGTIKEGPTFRFSAQRPAGHQFIAEATGLNDIPSASYDFVMSSHVLEHIANPLQALAEWVRVLKEDGFLLLVVPRKEGTFDHRRPVTTLAHLMQDFERGMGEDDLTHLLEILKLHDLSLDPQAGDFQHFKQRSERNVENRCLHHHVFDPGLMAELMEHLGLRLWAIELLLPIHIFVLAQKLGKNIRPDDRSVVLA